MSFNTEISEKYNKFNLENFPKLLEGTELEDSDDEARKAKIHKAVHYPDYGKLVFMKSTTTKPHEEN